MDLGFAESREINAALASTHLISTYGNALLSRRSNRKAEPF